MDAIDRKIIRALQIEGRLKISELSEIVGLSQTPCARRLERLQSDGVITGYGARVDQRKLGLQVTIFVSVELEQQAADVMTDFEQAVGQFEEVMECYLLTGSRDFLLRVVAADLEAFDAFLEHRLMKVKGVRNIQSNFALRALVQRDSLPV